MVGDISVEDIPEDGPIVLFDGVCNLCHGLVQYIVPRDPEGTFRFASLQSDIGEALLTKFELRTDELDSIVLIDGDECFLKSNAVLKIASHLGGVYRLLAFCTLVPKPLRDIVYDYIANNRYQWFGKTGQCEILTSATESRFVTANVTDESREIESK